MDLFHKVSVPSLRTHQKLMTVKYIKCIYHISTFIGSLLSHYNGHIVSLSGYSVCKSYTPCGKYFLNLWGIIFFLNQTPHWVHFIKTKFQVWKFLNFQLKFACFRWGISLISAIAHWNLPQGGKNFKWKITYRNESEIDHKHMLDRCSKSIILSYYHLHH